MDANDTTNTVRQRRGWRLLVAMLTCALVAAVATNGAAAAPAAGGRPPLQVLSPGAEGWFLDTLPVNVVFVGYEEGADAAAIDTSRFRAGLPGFVASIAVMPLYFGRLAPTNIGWFPDYRLHFADDAFEDELFGHLAAIGEQRPLTKAQNLYNEQASRSLDITDTIEIDGQAVEQWLADHAGPALGVDTSEPTVFFVNWHGRADFRFHVYRRLTGPDPDSGFDHSSQDANTLIAWGGTPAGPGEPTRRVWFHDLSAGPDWRTMNWNLTDADVDGDAVADHRMPPSWDYGSAGAYRPFDDLTADLAKVLRYVAIDELLVGSPLYEPDISAPVLPTTIDVSVNHFVAPGDDAALVRAPLVHDALAALQPWNSFTVRQRTEVTSRELDGVLDCYLSAWDDPAGVGESCYGNRAGGFAGLDPWLWVEDHRFQLTDTAADHSVPVISIRSRELPFAGLAEPDYRDGSQSFILQSTAPSTVTGWGQSRTLVHEVGHHLGLSHPHDGIDYEDGLVYAATGDFHFVWVGDESASVMGYLRLTNDFSQFERDVMGQWLAVAHLNRANDVLAAIDASPRAGLVDGEVVAADAAALQSVLAYEATDYAAAAALAKSANQRLLDAAAAIRVPIEPHAKPADVRAVGRSSFFVDGLSASHAADEIRSLPGVIDHPRRGPSAWAYDEE